VDEAQNVTHEQMEMITSRLGLRSKMIICGDSHQTDLKKKSDSGFRFLYAAARKIKNLEAITLTTNHRDPIVADLIQYYEEAIQKGISITTSGSYIYNNRN
jgi:phosphate starvation-inducible PhoH-like protein